MTNKRPAVLFWMFGCGFESDFTVFIHIFSDWCFLSTLLTRNSKKKVKSVQIRLSCYSSRTAHCGINLICQAGSVPQNANKQRWDQQQIMRFLCHERVLLFSVLLYERRLSCSRLSELCECSSRRHYLTVPKQGCIP